MRAARPPPRVVELLIARRVVHEHDRRAVGRREIGAQPFELRLRHADLRRPSLRACGGRRSASRAGPASSRAGRFAARSGSGRRGSCGRCRGCPRRSREARRLRAGSTGTRRSAAGRPRATRPRCRRPGSRRGPVAPPRSSAARRRASARAREVRHLAELAVEVRLRAEVQVGDDADRDAVRRGHGPSRVPQIAGRDPTPGRVVPLPRPACPGPPAPGPLPRPACPARLEKLWYSSLSMRPIVIGAGRGSRLGPETDEVPKALVPVMGRPMLDWILDALGAAGFARKDVLFICGYRVDVVRARYPELSYVENRDWERNNILGSLLCARAALAAGFVSTLRRHRLPRLDREEARRLAARQGARLRHGLAPPLRRPQSAPRDGRREDARGGRRASSSCRAASPPSARAGSSSASRSSRREGAREMVAAFDDAQAARRPARPGARDARSSARTSSISSRR